MECKAPYEKMVDPSTPEADKCGFVNCPIIKYGGFCKSDHSYEVYLMSL